MTVGGGQATDVIASPEVAAWDFICLRSKVLMNEIFAAIGLTKNSTEEFQDKSFSDISC